LITVSVSDVCGLHPLRFCDAIGAGLLAPLKAIVAWSARAEGKIKGRKSAYCPLICLIVALDGSGGSGDQVMAQSLVICAFAAALGGCRFNVSTRLKSLNTPCFFTEADLKPHGAAGEQTRNSATEVFGVSLATSDRRRGAHMNLTRFSRRFELRRFCSINGRDLPAQVSAFNYTGRDTGPTGAFDVL